MLRRVKTPVVLVTGASQGIGAAIARVFAKGIPGVKLALVARSATGLARVARGCKNEDADARTFPCDVSDEAAVDGLKTSVLKAFGRVDVLINNAGKFLGRPFLEMSVAEFDAMLAANLRSTFLVSKAFAPAMVARRRGDIYNMSSIAGLDAYPGGAGYCAAKFGVTGLSKVLREELKSHGIRVCCVHPGATVSPSWSKSGVDLRRLMPAEDIARAFFSIYQLGRNTVVEEIILRPQGGDI